MKLNRQVTMPGVDQLGFKNQNVLDYKETQTVSELEDKPFMAEVLTWIGWRQTPNDMKACTNAATAFGVTHHVPHCITTNRDMGLTQYPADFYTQNPYWQYLDQWADYTKRAAYVTRMTKLNADILLLNPIESVWAYNEPYFQKLTQPNYFFWDRDPDWNKDARRVDSVYAKCMREMADKNLDFLIGDTHYMSKAKAAANGSFVINNHEFKVIVVPEMLVMAHSTANKLLELAKKNVPIVIISDLPTSSPDKGFNDDHLQRIMKQLLSNKSVVDLRNQGQATKMFTSKIKEIIPAKISFEGNKVPVYFAHRTFGKKHFYWIANKTNEKISTSFRLKYGEGQAQRWDSENGTIKPIDYKKDKAGALIKYEFVPYEGFWIVFDDQLAPVNEVNNSNVAGIAKETILLNPTWTISSDTTFECQVTAAVEVKDIKHHHQVSEKDSSARMSVLGKSPVPGTFWKIRIPLNAEKVSIPGLEDGLFYIDEVPVKLNNDVTLIPENAKYLFISSAKRNNRTFINRPLLFTCTGKTKSPLKSWSDYGLSQYTGFLYYENEFIINETNKVARLDLGKVSYMAEVWVNNRLVGSRLWSPFTFDISKFVRAGGNTIRIKVGNLYLNQSSVDDDVSLHLYKRIRASRGMNKPKWNEFDAGLIGPVKVNLLPW
jgi:UDP-N-acetylglucosamine transferase subunit ALG13